MFRSVLVIIAVVLGAAGCASASTGTAPLDPRTASTISHWAIGPGQFVSVRDTRSGSAVVALSDVSTGAMVRNLLPATATNGMQVTGLAVDHAGDLWITYSKGPAYGGHVAGGDPHPHTCANQIDVLHTGTGRVTVALRTGDNVRVWAAQPSPDGRELAYRESACAAYQDSYLRIDNVSSERQWSIGQGLPHCHLLAGAEWSVTGRTLLADYGPASPPYSYGGSQGVCAQWRAGRLVQVNAGAARRGLSGTTVLADPGCQIDAVGGTKGGGALAVEGCGGGADFLSGQVSLLVITPNGRINRRLPLGACVDGAAVAMNETGTAALISAYLYCNPPGHPAPATRVWEYRDGTLRQVAKAAANPTMLTWLS